MRKSKILYGIVLAFGFFFGGSLSGFCQQKDAAKKREIREKAYNLIVNGYDTYASVSNDESYYAFLRLFTSEESPVYNDLLGVSSEKMLPVGDYARLLNGSGISAKYISIKNIQMEEEPNNKGGKWKVSISFDKEMSYYTKCNVYFSSREFYQADYHFIASVVYDEVDGRCRIERIDGSISSNNKLPSEYTVLNQGDERDKLLMYNKEPLKFNSNHQAILSGAFDKAAFSHPKYKNTDLHPNIDECNIVTMHYGTNKQKLMAIRPYIGIGMGNSFSVSDDGIFDNMKSSEFSFGIDFGYQFANMSSLKLSAFAGLGITSSSIKDMKYGPKDYSYAAGKEADIDGDTYVRCYKGLTIAQEVSMTEFSLPLYLDAEFGFSETVAAYMDLGLRFNFNTSKKIDVKEAKADEIYGIYSQYGNLLLDGSWGYNGFTNSMKKIENNAGPEFDGVSGMNTDIIGGFGLRYYIPNSSIGIDLGMGFQMGMGDLIKSDKNDKEPSSLISYTVKDGEQVKSLTNLLDNVKRKSLRLNIGVVYKF